MPAGFTFHKPNLNSYLSFEIIKYSAIYLRSSQILTFSCIKRYKRRIPEARILLDCMLGMSLFNGCKSLKSPNNGHCIVSTARWNLKEASDKHWQKSRAAHRKIGRKPKDMWERRPSCGYVKSTSWKFHSTRITYWSASSVPKICSTLTR